MSPRKFPAAVVVRSGVVTAAVVRGRVDAELLPRVGLRDHRRPVRVPGHGVLGVDDLPDPVAVRIPDPAGDRRILPETAVLGGPGDPGPEGVTARRPAQLAAN